MASLVEGRQSAQNYSDSDDENKKKVDKGKQRATETYEEIDKKPDKGKQRATEPYDETDKKPDKGKGKAPDNRESSRPHGASTQSLLHPDAAGPRFRNATRVRPSTATQQHQPSSEPSGSRAPGQQGQDYPPFEEMQLP
ncbi:hypothetical protein ACHAPJ_003079 [Fusarium lateritium]